LRDIEMLSFELWGVSEGIVKLRWMAGASERGLADGFEALDGADEGASDGALTLLTAVDAAAGTRAFLASEVAAEMTVSPVVLRLSLRFEDTPLRHVSSLLFPASEAASSATGAPS
jgi:hypothetical protein